MIAIVRCITRIKCFLFANVRYIGKFQIASVYSFWRETAERNFAFFTMPIKQISPKLSSLFSIVKKPKFLSAVSDQILYTDDIVSGPTPLLFPKTVFKHMDHRPMPRQVGQTVYWSRLGLHTGFE